MEMQQAAQDRIVKIGAQVSFAAAVASGSSYTCEDGPVLQMLAQLSTFRHLHSEVCENGEAYGGGATYGAQNGIFTYFNFRNPNPIVDRKHLAVSVRSEGATNFNYDVDDEMKQARRESLLDCDLHRAAIV
ncbi:hypothetical protein KL918_002149 [Ogataea parapolymorpha]|nr:hypothetical protein KL918_002149 [Ogataea parapolymorpha]KAG7871738.1 hypothetical protein KL916_003838 [Ogataea parapolymorpha]